MPRRNDIAKILIIGSGPIVIGQSAEFDYSGTQACKALKAEGYEVVLANSNPATIMTDPEMADRTYIEPLTKTYLEEIIRQESEMLRGQPGKFALINNLKDGLDFSGKIGFPLIIRPSFTLGGSGGGIAYNREEMLEILARGLDLSPVHEVLIEESVLGWKEYELEVMRDLADNVIIVCSIEN